MKKVIIRIKATRRKKKKKEKSEKNRGLQGLVFTHLSTPCPRRPKKCVFFKKKKEMLQEIVQQLRRIKIEEKTNSWTPRSHSALQASYSLLYCVLSVQCKGGLQLFRIHEFCFCKNFPVCHPCKSSSLTIEFQPIFVSNP